MNFSIMQLLAIGFVGLLIVAGIWSARGNWRGYCVGALVGGALTLVLWVLVTFVTVWVVNRYQPASAESERSMSMFEHLYPFRELLYAAGIFITVLGTLIGGLGGAFFLSVRGSKSIVDQFEDDEEEAKLSRAERKKKNKQKNK